MSDEQDSYLSLTASIEDLDKPTHERNTPARLNTGPDKDDQGLAKLVLTLVEFLRRVMEHEALRRIEGNTLTEAEIEKMGEAFFKLDQKMTEMREIFGLKPEDLNLDLGPLGDLM